jgi:hypothetical protein
MRRVKTTPTHKKAFVYIDYIINNIQRLPGGYQFASNLPKKGRKSLQTTRRIWGNKLQEYLFDDEFKTACLQLCLIPQNGMPHIKGRKLYKWMVEYVYNGVESRLYRDYIRLIKDKI